MKYAATYYFPYNDANRKLFVEKNAPLCESRENDSLEGIIEDVLLIFGLTSALPKPYFKDGIITVYFEPTTEQELSSGVKGGYVTYNIVTAEIVSGVNHEEFDKKFCGSLAIFGLLLNAHEKKLM